MSAARIYKDVASRYAGPGEAIYEFSDGRSGGLISLRRIGSGELVVDVYRIDDDVLVRGPRAGE